MAVLPESMDRLNVEDTKASLSVIENYIRYMGERIEFSMRNVTKSVSAAGVSSAEIYLLVAAMSNTLSALQSTVNVLSGNITSLSNNHTSIQEKLDYLDGKEAVVDEFLQMQQTQLANLEARVAAIEAK